MPNSDFKPFATASGANVQTQADFLASSALSTGYQAGTASSAACNKTWRQSSFIAAGLAQWVSTVTNTDVPDDGDLDAFVAKLTQALRNVGPWRQVVMSPGSGTFIVPAGCYSLDVELGGAGGGGGGSTGAASVGAGGGPGAYIRFKLFVTPGQAINWTVGAAGTGGSNAGGTGATGGSSAFSTVTAGGGAGGQGAAAGAIATVGGTVGTLVGAPSSSFIPTSEGGASGTGVGGQYTSGTGGGAWGSGVAPGVSTDSGTSRPGYNRALPMGGAPGGCCGGNGGNGGPGMLVVRYGGAP